MKKRLAQAIALAICVAFLSSVSYCSYHLIASADKAHWHAIAKAQEEAAAATEKSFNEPEFVGTLSNGKKLYTMIDE